jgi:hypothetical protein
MIEERISIRQDILQYAERFAKSEHRRRSALSNHLRALEAESIFIMREVVAEFRNPVLLYSIGKDSSVMLHLAIKAFWPAKPPFPLMHIATGWDFHDMIDHRDQLTQTLGLRSSFSPTPKPKPSMNRSDGVAGCAPWTVACSSVSPRFARRSSESSSVGLKQDSATRCRPASLRLTLRRAS